MKLMALKRKKTQGVHSRVLRLADEISSREIEDDSLDELSRVGTLWSGVLGLDEPIEATEVAAMLCAYELIKATRLVDAEPHWTNVASFAAIGASCEKPEVVIDPLIDEDFNDKMSGSPIGFSPGHTTSPRN